MIPAVCESISLENPELLGNDKETEMSTDILASAVPGFWELIIVFLIAIPLYILPVIVFWKICSKAGFPGVLGLLMLVPIANIVLPFYIAFADWPVLRDRGQAAP